MSPAISGKNWSRRKAAWRLSYRFLEHDVVAQAAIDDTTEDAKAFWLRGVLLSGRDSGQQNWGRTQAEAQAQYARALQAPAVRTRPVPKAWKATRVLVVPQGGSLRRSRPRVDQKKPLQALTKAVVLERLDGFVEQIEGPTAYVTLKSQHGDELTGEYAADELAAKGITEGRRFRCETVEVDGAVRVLFEAVPDEPVTEDEEDAISGRIDGLLQDDELDGDY
jgi:hypothetical protein